jgi:DNA polymerase-3 subunit alpha
LLGGGSSGAGVSVQSLPLPIITETPQDYKEQLAWEKELLGMYVSDHPIARALEGLDMTGITSIGQISDELAGQTLTFVGMLSQSRRVATKKGDSMLVAMFEDLEATIEIVAFPKSYEKYRNLLSDDALLRVVAKVDKSRRDETMQLLLESAETLEARAADVAAKSQAAAVEMDLEGLGEQIMSTDITDVRMDRTETLPPDESATSISDSISQSAKSVLESAETVDTTAVSIIRPRVKVGANGHGNGNGNGHSNGNGASHTPPAQALQLHFPRSPDFDADVRLMQTVDRVLRQSEGESEVIIRLPNAAGTVLLKPRHKVHCNDALVGALRAVLGEMSVVVG